MHVHTFIFSFTTYISGRVLAWLESCTKKVCAFTMWRSVEDHSSNLPSIQTNCERCGSLDWCGSRLRACVMDWSELIAAWTAANVAGWSSLRHSSFRCFWKSGFSVSILIKLCFSSQCILSWTVRQTKFKSRKIRSSKRDDQANVSKAAFFFGRLRTH